METQELHPRCGTRKPRPRFVAVPQGDRGWTTVPVLYARRGLAVTPSISHLGRYIVTHLRTGYRVTWRSSLSEARQTLHRLLDAGRWTREVEEIMRDSRIRAAVILERAEEEL